MSSIDNKQWVLPIFGDPTAIEPEPEGVDAMLNALRQAGAPLEIALKSGGFTDEDYKAWLDNEESQDLIKEIRKAEADFCIRALKQVVNSADMGDAKSAQWLLERRYTAHFGRPSKSNTSVSLEQEEIVIDEVGTDLLSEISEEEFRLMAVEVLRKKLTLSEETESD